jgi:serine/threonine protein kinase
MINKALGHYRVGEQLGRGGMGEVYVADDLNLNRKVALKFLPDAFAGDPERMARFEREARLLASLNHPNIAAIYGLEQAEGKRFIVMELVEGETLAARISKGALPIDDALAICHQIAEGLEAAHEKGVIHRDLKPANVMITEGDKIKILDFGLAKAFSEEAQSVDSSQSPTLTEAMTRPGVMLGTAAYMSPEQAKGKAVDKRADIWAFGCMLYENVNTGPANSSVMAPGIMGQGLVATPAMPESSTASPASYPSSGESQYNSGRTKQQRDAALAAVNAELDRMPFLLPKKANAPTKNDILMLAGRRNATAHKSFSPSDAAAYPQIVTWIPRFDGVTIDVNTARKFSMVVPSATGYSDKPQLIIAVAAAVFSLDPESAANANNLAAAIVTGGELLNPGIQIKSKAFATYQSEAESCFLYALAKSMKGDAWTDKSLTSLLNLGNLYTDMGKVEEARSLFQVARKQSPFSWDAAQGMAAYFYAVNKPDKALAVIEDDNLDRPQSLMIAKKHARALEKNDEVPPGLPKKVYEERIESVNAVPIETAADFIAQLDQSTRNKLRYFVEHLPPAKSFTAPSIKS